jgi:hypothetical protein
MAFDLSLENYGLPDLVGLFQLPVGYTENDVDEKENLLRVQLMGEDMPEADKVRLGTFLETARDMIKRDWRKRTLQPNDIIPRPSIPYFPVHTEEYTKGDVNPYKKQTLAKLVNLDSMYRENFDNTTAGNFQCTLPETVRNAVTMQLEAINLPCNNIATFAEAFGTSAMVFRWLDMNQEPVEATVRIPDGSYSNAELELLLNKLFLVHVPWLQAVITRGRLTLFSRPDAAVFDTSDPYEYIPGFNYTVTFPALLQGAETLGTKLGFALSSYTAIPLFVIPSPNGGADKVFRNYLVAESFVRNERCAYYFLEVDDFQNNHATNNLVTNIPGNPGNNLLARIDVRDDVIVISPNKRDYLGPVRIEKLNLRLLDRYGQVVTWISDYSVALQFTLIYS